MSYGGLSGGTRAVQMLKQSVTTLKMMPMVEAVAMPFFTQYYNAEGQFTPNDNLNKELNRMLDELAKWGDGLKAMREVSANKKAAI